MVNKLILSVVLFFLAVFSFFYYGIVWIALISLILSISILVEFFVSKKNIKRSFSPSATELDMLENSVLLVQDLKSLFTIISKFLSDKFSPQFFCYVTLSNYTSGYTVEYYEESVDQSNSILHILLEERRNSEETTSLILHKYGAISFPFFKNNNVEGYVFVGQKNSGKKWTESELSIMKPIARIIGKIVLLLENGQYKKEKNQLQSAFSKYVSPEVVDQIILHPEIMHLGGEKQFLTCIFTDLQGFTAMSDSMDPVKLVRVLNMYLNEMSEVIIALGGTIDKFEGDAIMAFFGAPIPFLDHAVRCCKAALRMKKMEAIINNQLLAENIIDKPLFTRIGINSGDMVVGNVGSLKRIDYTIIGGNVNIAARLENANKEYNTSILISQSTYELVKDFFEVRLVGDVKLRGISKPITAYELISEKVENDSKYEPEKNLEVLEELEIVDEN